jgi:predicted protein tyrosine phosphatase
MIESIIITSFAEAKHKPYQKDLKQNLWITVIDPEDETAVKKINTRFAKHKVKHHYQFFRDWSDEDAEAYIQERMVLEGPQERHINNIISFLDNYVRDSAPYHLGINCFAGISRSSAVGIIAWVMQGKTVEEALSEIVRVNPGAWPNLRILRLASARLGKNIMTPVLDWKKQQSEKGIITSFEL